MSGFHLALTIPLVVPNKTTQEFDLSSSPSSVSLTYVEALFGAWWYIGGTFLQR